MLAPKKLGRRACEACDFEFKARYGEVGDGYIEFHHARRSDLGRAASRGHNVTMDLGSELDPMRFAAAREATGCMLNKERRPFTQCVRVLPMTEAAALQRASE